MRWNNGSNHMLNYERNRLFSFENAERGYHSNEDFRHAYYKWAEAPPLARQKLWNEYCDVRDGYAIGTNTKIQERHKQQARLSNEPRYISLK